jgi:hypothetical protein
MTDLVSTNGPNESSVQLRLNVDLQNTQLNRLKNWFANGVGPGSIAICIIAATAHSDHKSIDFAIECAVYVSVFGLYCYFVETKDRSAKKKKKEAH